MAYVVTTPNDIIRLALQDIGAIGQNEAVSPGESQDALLRLNGLIGTWANKSLLVYCITRNIFTPVVAKQVYTLGLGGDFDTGLGRPQRIEKAFVQVLTSGQPTELELEVLSYEKWSQIPVKTVTSTFPLKMWPDYNFPKMNLSFFPSPSQLNPIILYLWETLQQFSSFAQQIILPPGYEEALRYNLAVRLAAPYGKDIPDAVSALAVSTIGDIEALNSRMRDFEMMVDAALLPRKRPYNYLVGE